MQIAVLRVIVPEPKVHLRSKAIESSRCVGVKQRKYHQGKLELLKRACSQYEIQLGKGECEELSI